MPGIFKSIQPVSCCRSFSHPFNLRSVRKDDKRKGKTKSLGKRSAREKSKTRGAPEILAVLFMKALPATKETHYLLTMWNGILFTRLRFPLLLKLDFSILPFISPGIIISISQSLSLLKEMLERRAQISSHKTSD